MPRSVPTVSSKTSMTLGLRGRREASKDMWGGRGESGNTREQMEFSGSINVKIPRRKVGARGTRRMRFGRVHH